MSLKDFTSDISNEYVDVLGLEVLSFALAHSKTSSVAAPAFLLLRHDAVYTHIHATEPDHRRTF
jgi:hypothetical protein